MNLPEVFLKAKWKTESKFHKECFEDCQLAVDYLTKLTLERGDDYNVVGYTPILGEKIMTRFGIQKRIVKYDKELRPLDYWKDRFWDLSLLAHKRMKLQEKQAERKANKTKTKTKKK